MDSRNNILVIKDYFRKGYNYSEIQAMLLMKHDCSLGVRHIKRLMSEFGLHRRNHHSSPEDIVDFIMKELESAGQQLGYRYMYKKCIQAGLRVTHELVAEAVCLVDPDGVELRKRRKFI